MYKEGQKVYLFNIKGLRNQHLRARFGDIATVKWSEDGHTGRCTIVFDGDRSVDRSTWTVRNYRLQLVTKGKAT